MLEITGKMYDSANTIMGNSYFFKKRNIDSKNIRITIISSNTIARNRVVYNPNADFTIRIPGYSEDVLRGLSEASAEVAKRGGEDRLEHLILVDLNNGIPVYSETGDENSCGGGCFWKFVDNHKDEQYAFVHCHTEGSSLSETDVRTLTADNCIKMFIATRLDGLSYVIEQNGIPKTLLFDDLYEEEIKLLNQQHRAGMITAAERSMMREVLIVNNLINDYTKGLLTLE